MLCLLSSGQCILCRGNRSALHTVWGQLPITSLVLNTFPKAWYLLYLDTDAMLSSTNVSTTEWIESDRLWGQLEHSLLASSSTPTKETNKLYQPQTSNEASQVRQNTRLSNLPIYKGISTKMKAFHSLTVTLFPVVPLHTHISNNNGRW